MSFRRLWSEMGTGRSTAVAQFLDEIELTKKPNPGGVTAPLFSLATGPTDKPFVVRNDMSA
jgi:hypothetical protein